LPLPPSRCGRGSSNSARGHGGVPITKTEGAAAQAPFDFTWTFVLHDAPGVATRLLMRERYAYTQRWARAIVEPVEAVSFIMSQKMLRTIRDRAAASSAKTAAVMSSPRTCTGRPF
jgi:hypothetical protein